MYKDDNQGGLLKIKNNNVIFVAEAGQGQPVLVPNSNVKVLLNGEHIHTPVKITASDNVRIISQKIKIKNGELRLEIPNDLMTAVLQIKPDVFRDYEVPDREPQIFLPVKLREIIENVMPFSTQDIILLLQENSVVFGINQDRILKAITSPEEKTVIIAEGIPVEDSTGEEVEEFFATDINHGFFCVNYNSVDYRDHQKIPMVKPGDTLAVKRPGKPGEVGMTVTGQTIQPRPPEKITLLTGQGVECENEDKIIATIAGRPQVAVNGTQRKYSVTPVHHHRGNVSLESGNIKFNGDVVIDGDVMENMLVWADGNILIRGNICGAKIQAGKGVVIRGNSVSSSITASEKSITFSAIFQQTEELVSIVNTILKELSFLQQKAEIKDSETLGKALILIIQKHKDSLLVLIDSIIELLESSLIKPEITTDSLIAAGQKIKEATNVLKRNQVISVNEVLDFIKTTSQLADYFKNSKLQNDDIEVDSIQHCNIETTGDVRVFGKECYHSNIIASGKIDVHGLVLGGSLKSGDDIFANRVGSSFGVKTILRAPLKKTVKLNQVFELTEVWVEQYPYIFSSERKNVTLSFRNEHVVLAQH